MQWPARSALADSSRTNSAMSHSICTYVRFRSKRGPHAPVTPYSPRHRSVPPAARDTSAATAL
eukprot:7943772-Heterocapsa_arctica.AAC.1